MLVGKVAAEDISLSAQLKIYLRLTPHFGSSSPEYQTVAQNSDPVLLALLLYSPIPLLLYSCTTVLLYLGTPVLLYSYTLCKRIRGLHSKAG